MTDAVERQDVSQTFLDAEWPMSEICTAFVHKGNMPAYAVWEGFLRHDWPLISETIAHVRSELDAAKQRIAELEGERDSAVTWIRVVIEELANAGGKSGDRTVALENLRTLIRERASDRRTGFLECQRQAVECARHQAFDTTRSANWDTPQSACEAIAQAIFLLKPAEGDK